MIKCPFVIEILLNPNTDENKVIEEVDRVLEDLKINPPKENQIKQAQNTIVTDFFFNLQNYGGSSGIAEVLQSYNRFANDTNFLQKDINRYYKIDSKSLIDSLKYLTKDKRKILIAKPKGI